MTRFFHLALASLAGAALLCAPGHAQYRTEYAAAPLVFPGGANASVYGVGVNRNPGSPYYGYVYVTDYANAEGHHRILIYKPVNAKDATSATTYEDTGAYIDMPAVDFSNFDVYVGSDDTVWIANYGQGRILTAEPYRAGGGAVTPVVQIDLAAVKAGEGSPRGLFVRGTPRAALVYVATYNGTAQHVNVYGVSGGTPDSAGVAVQNLSLDVSGASSVGPYGVTADAEGNIYVTRGAAAGSGAEAFTVFDKNGNDISASKSFKLPPYAPALLQGTPDIVWDATYAGGGYIVYTGRAGSAAPYAPASFRWDLEGHYLGGFGPSISGAGPEYQALPLNGSSSVNYADLDESGNLYPRVLNADGQTAAGKVFQSPRFVTAFGAVKSSPTVVGGFLYYGDSAGVLHSVHADTGVTEFTIGDPNAGTPALLGRPSVTIRHGAVVVLYTDAHGATFRVDYDPSAQAGTSIVFATPPLVPLATRASTTPAVVDDGSGNLAIFAALGNSRDAARVFRLNPLSGAVEDQSPSLGADITSSPSVINGSVYIGAKGGTNGAYRLSATNLGTPLNDYAPGKSAGAPPFVLSTGAGLQRAYIVSEDGFLFCVNPATGNLDTGFGSGGSVRLSEDATFTGGPFVYDNVVYVGGSDNIVYAVNATDGSPAGPGQSNVFFDASQSGTPGSIVGGLSIVRPSTGGACIVFGSTNGRVYQVRTEDPSFYQVTLTDTSAENAVTTAPTVDPSLSSIFVGNDNGRVYRLPIFPISNDVIGQ